MVEIPHVAKVIIYVVGALDRLKRDGLLDGGTHQLSDSGRSQYEALLVAGFTPTTAEIHAAMAFLQSRGMENG